MTTENNAPRDVLRDGNLKATIWKSEGEKGPFYSANLARTYKDENGELRDSHSFAGAELLRVSELARKAYDRTQALRREDRTEKKPEPDREARRDAFQERRSGGAAAERRPEPRRG